MKNKLVATLSLSLGQVGRKIAILCVWGALLLTSGIVIAEEPRSIIAVMPFKAINLAQSDATSAMLLFETALQNTGEFIVIEQVDVSEILNAQKYSLSGYVDETHAIEIGRLLSADQLVLGTAGRVDRMYYLTVKVIAVQSGEILIAKKIQSESLLKLTTQMEMLAQTLSGNKIDAETINDDGYLAPSGSEYDSETEYNRNRLIIYYKDAYGSWKEARSSTSSYSDWRYHEGFNKISEGEFLEIAGYTEEAKQAAKHVEKRNISMVSTIGLASVGGIILLATGAEYSATSLPSVTEVGFESWEVAFDNRNEIRNRGMMAGLVVAVLAAIPAIYWYMYTGNWMPLEQAFAIQKEYNQKLMESLRVEAW